MSKNGSTYGATTPMVSFFRNAQVSRTQSLRRAQSLGFRELAGLAGSLANCNDWIAEDFPTLRQRTAERYRCAAEELLLEGKKRRASRHSASRPFGEGLI